MVLLAELASQEDGFNEILRISFEAPKSRSKSPKGSKSLKQGRFLSVPGSRTGS